MQNIEEEEGETFPITITARMRHGRLWELRKKFKTNVAMAEYLGVSSVTVGDWLNLKRMPNLNRNSRGTYQGTLLRHREKWVYIEKQLAQLGFTLEDIFPESLSNKAFLSAPKTTEVMLEMPIHDLLLTGAIPVGLPSPEEEYALNEIHDKLMQSLGTLTPREARVLKLRFGLSDGMGHEKTFKEVGEELGVTSERVRQIAAKAFRKLRHPSRAKNLEPLLEELE